MNQNGSYYQDLLKQHWDGIKEQQKGVMAGQMLQAAKTDEKEAKESKVPLWDNKVDTTNSEERLRKHNSDWIISMDPTHNMLGFPVKQYSQDPEALDNLVNLEQWALTAFLS